MVSRENLGENPSLVAGASLLVDYILTVAVSISAGVAAIVSIPEFRDLQDHRVALGLVLILLISLAAANLSLTKPEQFDQLRKSPLEYIKNSLMGK